MHTYIIVDINADLDPVTYATDTDDEIADARAALRDAGLAYEHIYAGDPGCPDAYRTDRKLFAA